MTNIKKTILIGMSAIALQGISVLAFANEQESIMAKLDKNLDGVISLEEAANHANVRENFAQIDTNGDGVVSLEELIASGVTGG